MYTVYKTTNTLDGKFYIGVHKTNNPNDSYLGSGIAIKAAIKAAGKDVFQKEILASFDKPEEAYHLESQLVMQEAVDDPMCYNLTKGGVPTADWFEDRKDHYRRNIKTFLGRTHTEETKRKISEAGKGRRQSRESIEQGAAKRTGRKHTWRGKESPEANAKRSASHLKLEKLQCPICSKYSSPQNSKRWHFENCKPSRARFAVDR